MEYNHQKGTAFLNIPSIYAVELTAACDLQCPMCLRTTDMHNKKPTLFSYPLLETMIERGDFDGTTYCELQMAGEPTIHPQLHQIIYRLTQIGVKVGLSTHGHNLHKEHVQTALLDLDALTISVDSADPEVYARMRVPKTLKDLVENINLFCTRYERRKRAGNKVPFVELQLVRTPREPNSGDLAALQRLIDHYRWPFNTRITDDCFTEMQGLVQVGHYVPRPQAPCLNPFLSVNISQDGDVVSCCYIFDRDTASINYYGSLKEQTLREIWEGPRASAMRHSQTTGKLENQCQKCYYRSPVLIHHGITARLQRHEKEQGL